MQIGQLKPFSPEKTNKIYDILVHCGAEESKRAYFLAQMTNELPYYWHFQGIFGVVKFYPKDMMVKMYPRYDG